MGESQQAGVSVYLACKLSALKWKKTNVLSEEAPALSVTQCLQVSQLRAKAVPLMMKQMCDRDTMIGAISCAWWEQALPCWH